MTDARTLEVYARAVDAYDRLTGEAGHSGDLDAFLSALPEGPGPVLDWGAGPGRDAARMIAAGIDCEAVDAAPAMVERARARGVPARCETFDRLDARSRYRGIWTSFALLHAEAEALPGLIARAAHALVPGGVLHLGMKRGRRSARDALGRRYVYVEADDLDTFTRRAGLVVLSLRHGRSRGLDGRPADHLIHLSRRPHA